MIVQSFPEISIIGLIKVLVLVLELNRVTTTGTVQYTLFLNLTTFDIMTTYKCTLSISMLGHMLNYYLGPELFRNKS